MKRTRNAFTLVEMLIVIAIISVLAAMAISSFSNAAQDSRNVVAKQQHAVVQQAVSNWAARQIGKVSTVGGKPASIEDVRTLYNTPTTVSDRLLLFQGYLDAATLEGITAKNDTGRITTDAMAQIGFYLTLPTWAGGSYPKVTGEYIAP